MTGLAVEELWVSRFSKNCGCPGFQSRYWRAIGAADRLLEKAEAIGQRWLKGIGTTRALQARPVTSIA